MGGRSLKALRVGVAVAWQGAFFPCEKTPQSPGPFEVLAFLKMSCFFHVLHRVNISRRNNCLILLINKLSRLLTLFPG